MTPHLLPRRSCRRGYSLAEMLIVVSIMIMLMAVSLPVAKKMMDGSQVREASRQLHAYFAMARSRALQTGRPCGLYFPFPQPPLGVTDDLSSSTATQYWPVRHVTQVFLAEVPPYYSGSTTVALGKICNPTGGPGQREFVPIVLQGGVYQVDQNELIYLRSLIDQEGEVFFVRFNYKGEWYRCMRGRTGDANYGNPNNFYYLGLNSTYPYGYNEAPAAGGRPFQVMRMPRPVGNALELPRGSCIDITYSGVLYSGDNTSLLGFPRPPAGLSAVANGLAVMIAPTGEIDSLYMNGSPTNPPASSLFFLIGKPEKVPSTSAVALSTLFNPLEFTNPERSNLADPTSLWVTVSRNSGQVTTAENMPPPIDGSNISATALRIFPGEQSPPSGRFEDITTNRVALARYLFYCRQAAIYGQQMGGQ